MKALFVNIQVLRYILTETFDHFRPLSHISSLLLDTGGGLFVCVSVYHGPLKQMVQLCLEKGTSNFSLFCFQQADLSIDLSAVLGNIRSKRSVFRELTFLTHFFVVSFL